MKEDASLDPAPPDLPGAVDTGFIRRGSSTSLKLALILALATTAIAARGAAEPPPAVPHKLTASIEGFDGASYKVELANAGNVTYLHNPRTFTGWAGTKRSQVRIPAERWIAFRHQLDAAKVWSWKAHYRDPSISDGTVWHLEIAYADRRITSDGDNAYPPRKQFAAFRAAIQELIGGKRFE